MGLFVWKFRDTCRSFEFSATIFIQTDETIIKVLYNSEFEFSKRLYAVLDVDLSKIRLYHSLSDLTRQSLLYIKDSIPEKCFRWVCCILI